MDEDKKGLVRPSFSIWRQLLGLGAKGIRDHERIVRDLQAWNAQRKLKELERVKQVRLVGALVNSSMSNSPILDRFITSLLAFLGAAFVLAFTNLESTVSALPRWSITIGLIGALLTAILGFLQRLIALGLHTSLEIGAFLDKRFRELQEEHAALMSCLRDEASKQGVGLEEGQNWNLFMESISRVFGRNGPKILEAMEKAMHDPVEMMKMGYLRLQTQRRLALSVLLCFIVTLTSLVIGVISILF